MEVQDWSLVLDVDGLLDLPPPSTDFWFDDFNPFLAYAVTCFGLEPAPFADENCWMQLKAQKSWFEFRLFCHTFNNNYVI